MFKLDRCSAAALKGAVSVIALVVASPSLAASLPSHGHFVSGQGTIAKGNQSVTVKQSSTTGIIDWNNFSVGKGDGVSFRNGSGATLNRVTSGNLSTIAGSLHATGSLYIMNSAGVIVSGTGHIVTGGSFVASSGNIGSAFDNQRFKAGAGNVVNKGTIVSGGSTALVGRNVATSGSIRASSVQLSATHKLGITGSITAQSSGAGGSVTARARTIVIGTDGDIDASASGAGQKGGTISVVARGTTEVAGTLKAEGGDHGNGGFIETSGAHVHVDGSADISTLAANGKTGEWLIDPQDFTIAPSGGDISGATLSSELASNDVLIQSITNGPSGNGDIFVDDAVTWSSGHTLTLDAYRNIYFNATITVAGAGGLVLIDADQTQTSGTPGANDGNTADGDLIFNTGGNVAFTNVASGDATALSINGQAYTLENNISDLATAIAGNSAGYYALANNYDAAGDNGGNPYTTSPIPSLLQGTFEGLGNTISNVTISSDDYNLGFFDYNDGTVRDFHLANINVTAGADSGYVGGLVADNSGTIKNVSITGSIVSTGGTDAGVGGLVCYNSIYQSYPGVIIESSSAVSITVGDGEIAGGLLAYQRSGTVEGSYATGTVSGGDNSNVGGLVGWLDGGTVETSYATGAVSGGGSANVGGLVGYSDTGTIETSYATGTVTGGGSAYIGGLLGDNHAGMVETSYATGAVTAGGDAAQLGGLAGRNEVGATIESSYASGAVSSTYQNGDLGGLVGDNGGGVIAATYATGAVSGGVNSDDGGLVGINSNAASSSIDESYELGAVSAGSGAIVGGIVGQNLSSTMGSTHGNYFNSTANPSLSGVGGGQAGSASPESFTSLQNTSTFQNWNFGGLGSGKDWVIVDSDGSLNGSNGGTTPMLLSEYSTTITNAHQLQLMALDLTATYTLANNVDASATGNGTDVWGSAGFVPVGNDNVLFSGTFEGLGNTISNLTVNASTEYAGLFGASSGTIRNIGMVGGSIAGTYEVGGLVGWNEGAISDSYTTGGVNSASGLVGGLVGENDGTIALSYATGAVAGNGAFVGGLVGKNTASIADSYSTGAVSGNSDTGGLVGLNSGGATISDSYTTSAVTGPASSPGGLVGFDNGTITNSYWDTQTSGNASVGVGGGLGSTAGVYEATTADLTKKLPSGWDTTIWGDVNGQTTPYLLALTSNPQTVFVHDGSEGAFQLLFTMAQVQAINDTLNGNYALANSLDASSVTSWSPIGYSGESFAGILDGLGNTISDLTINGGNAVGLIGYSNGTIRNIGLVGGSVNGANYVGGLVGVQDGGSISDSYATNSVNVQNQDGGGLVGYLESGSVNDSYATGAVSGATVGGLVGQNGGTINGSYSTGSITGGWTGGLVGYNSGSVNNSYWDIQTSGQSSSAGGTGVLTTADLTEKLPTGFSSAIWGDVHGQTTPYLLALTSNPQTVLIGDGSEGAFQLLFNMAQVQNISANMSGNYALASSLDASSVTNWIPIGTDGQGNVENGGFTGTFDGLSNTISNLTVNIGSGYAGLFGVSQGTIRNVGIVGGSVAGGGDAGGLVGRNNGTISNSFATDSVQGSGVGNGVGGLVGVNFGTIDNSYATGTVNAGASDTGGLVGLTVGGSISDSYATGAVSGEVAGGLLGFDTGGKISDSFWDTQTSGLADGVGEYHHNLSIQLTGLTTAQLQSGLPGMFSNTVWGTGAGLYPYLKSFFPDGVRAISGFAYSDAGSTLLAPGTLISAVVDGSVVASASTGADGYYYILLPATKAAHGILAYANGVSTGAAFADIASGDASANIESNLLSEATAQGTYSATAAALRAAIGSDSDAQSLVSGLQNLDIDALGASFDINKAIHLGSGSLDLNADGSVSETGAGAIDAASLTGSSGGGVTLNGSNAIAALGVFSTGGDNAFAFTDDRRLAVEGAIDAGTADLSLTTTGVGSYIAIVSTLSGGAVDLTSSASIHEYSRRGAIDAQTLSASAVHKLILHGLNNSIAAVGNLQSGSDIILADGRNLTIDGDVDSSGHNTLIKTHGAAGITLKGTLEAKRLTLQSAGSIAQTASSMIDVDRLNGSSKGKTSLTSSTNAINTLGAFTASGFALDDDHALTVVGDVNAGAGSLSLSTVGTNQNLVVASILTGGTIDLTTTGRAMEANKGAIVADKVLNVTANSGIKLNSKHNAITKLGTDKTMTGPNKVTL